MLVEEGEAGGRGLGEGYCLKIARSFAVTEAVVAGINVDVGAWVPRLELLDLLERNVLVVIAEMHSIGTCGANSI